MVLRKLTALVVMTAGSALAPLHAQSWQIEDEISYATSMARFRLFDLATHYLDKISSQGMSTIR